MTKLNSHRILLVHPLGYQASAAKADIARKANLMPPLGLASIAAYLEENDKKADILDCFAVPLTADRRFKTYLEMLKPAWVGFSCTTSSFLDGVRLAELAKEILPGIKTFCGGPHVSALKDKLLADYPAFDYLVIGEGEETILQLMDEAENCAGIPGLAFWNSRGKTEFTGYREPGVELDRLPFPA
ncbi:MAG: B12-binding domain-containing radical SAM protein, partial [Deltaproteobacteria bacterium]